MGKSGRRAKTCFYHSRATPASVTIVVAWMVNKVTQLHARVRKPCVSAELVLSLHLCGSYFLFTAPCTPILITTIIMPCLATQTIRPGPPDLEQNTDRAKVVFFQRTRKNRPRTLNHGLDLAAHWRMKCRTFSSQFQKTHRWVCQADQ